MADEYSPDDLITQRPDKPVTFSVRPERDDDEKPKKKAGPRADRSDDAGPSRTLEFLKKYIVPGEAKAYNEMYGGGRFSDYSQHPNQHILITSGPNKGLTSSAAGLYQFIKPTWDRAAAATGTKDFSPASQDRNAEWLARDTYKRKTGRDLELDLANPDPKKIAEIKSELASEWESLGKGGPRSDSSQALGNDRFRWGDRSLDEHNRAKDTDLVMMSPGDYLDLSPQLEGKPFDSASGRSLMKSFNRGDAIESIPTLDVASDGGVGTVTDQDGRHRALLAQQNGLDQIPVAIRRTGEAPQELVGMRGDVVPNKFSPVADFLSSAAKRVGEAIIPSAEAKEPTALNAGDDTPAGFAPVQAAAPARTDDGTPAGFAPVGGGPQTQQQSPADKGVLEDPVGAFRSFGSGISQGVGKTMFGAQELVGKGMSAVGIPGGEALTADARERANAEEKRIAEDKAAHPYLTGAGEVLGGSLVPAGIGMRAAQLGAGVVGANALAGGAAGLLEPVGSDKNFFGDKEVQAGVGAGVGALGGAVGNKLAQIGGGVFRQHLKTLLDEGVELTPGQMAGGLAKHWEDLAMSAPGLGDAIAAARQRGLKDFNKAAWNRALEPIGEKMPDTVPMGREAADYVGDRLSAKYGSIVPNLRLRNIMSDPVWVNDMTAAIQNARATLPDSEFANFERITRAQIEQKLGAARGGGSADGELLNGIDSMLGRDVRGYKGSQEHDKRKLGEALEDVQVAFRNLLERQNPAYAQDLREAREGYANYVRVAKAGASTGTATHEGIFTPAQLNAAVRAEDHTTRKLGYGRGKALLQDLSDAGQSVLPSKYPDSGTAKRGIVNIIGSGALTGSGAAGHPGAAMGTLAGLAAASVPYVRPVSQATNIIMNKLAQPAGAMRTLGTDALRMLGMAAGQGGANALAGRAPQQPAVLPTP